MQQFCDMKIQAMHFPRACTCKKSKIHFFFQPTTIRRLKPSLLTQHKQQKMGYTLMFRMNLTEIRIAESKNGTKRIQPENEERVAMSIKTSLNNILLPSRTRASHRIKGTRFCCQQYCST